MQHSLIVHLRIFHKISVTYLDEISCGGTPDSISLHCSLSRRRPFPTFSLFVSGGEITLTECRNEALTFVLANKFTGTVDNLVNNL